jgi:hypothetical protein
MTWTCSRCDRTFGTRRAHVCEAGLPIEFWLAERSEPQRRAAEAVLDIANAVDGLVIEAVTVGVLIKRVRTIVELRPMTKWLQLSFVTVAHVDDARISRTIALGSSTAYFVRLRDERDVDEVVRAWLIEALGGDAPAARAPASSAAAKRGVSSRAAGRTTATASSKDLAPSSPRRTRAGKSRAARPRRSRA